MQLPEGQMNTPLAKKELTKYQTNVLNLIVTGKSNKAVATELGICEKTVKFHLTNIYKFTGVKSRAELIVQYLNKEATACLS